MLRERNERAAQDSGALSELQEVLDRERGRADDLQVLKSGIHPSSLRISSLQQNVSLINRVKLDIDTR